MTLSAISYSGGVQQGEFWQDSDEWPTIEVTGARNDKKAIIGNQRITLDPDLMVFSQETIEI